MKVILKEAVPHLGNPGDIREVSGGYARNFLIPKALAAALTPGAQRQWRAEKDGIAKKLAHMKEAAVKKASQLENAAVTIKVRTGEGGKLFGSVTSHQIAKALEQSGISVSKQEIVLTQPLKELGTFPCEVRLHPEVSAKVMVTIVSE